MASTIRTHRGWASWILDKWREGKRERTRQQQEGESDEQQLPAHSADDEPRQPAVSSAVDKIPGIAEKGVNVGREASGLILGHAHDSLRTARDLREAAQRTRVLIKQEKDTLAAAGQNIWHAGQGLLQVAGHSPEE